jgi:site-specific recombinase XerD
MQPLITAFADHLSVKRHCRPATVARYVDAALKFGAFLADEPATAGLPLADVTRPLVLGFLNQSAEECGKPSPSVFNLRLAALRAFYEYLAEAGLVSADPSADIQRLKAEPVERVPLTLDEFLKLLEAVEASPLRYRSRNVAIVLTFFNSLPRVSELVSLNVAQVDFEEHTFLDVKTKGGEIRSIDFSDLVAGALEEYFTDRPKFRRLGQVVSPEDEDALFLSDRGTRLAVRTIEEMIKTYAERAGLCAFPHLLRHSGATELADLGTATHHVQRQLGHKSLETTEIYLHSGARSRRRALDKLGQAVAARRARRRGHHARQVPEVTVRGA